MHCAALLGSHHQEAFEPEMLLALLWILVCIYWHQYGVHGD